MSLLPSFLCAFLSTVHLFLSNSENSEGSGIIQRRNFGWKRLHLLQPFVWLVVCFFLQKLETGFAESAEMRQTLQSKRRCWRWKPLSWSLLNALLPFDYTSRRGTLVSPQQNCRSSAASTTFALPPGDLAPRWNETKPFARQNASALMDAHPELPTLQWYFPEVTQTNGEQVKKNVVNACHLFKSTLVHCVLSGWVGNVAQTVAL